MINSSEIENLNGNHVLKISPHKAIQLIINYTCTYTITIVQFSYINTQMIQRKIYKCSPTHTGHSYTCSIDCPLHIAPRSDCILIDVSWLKSIVSTVTSLHHITFTDQKTSPTSDVDNLHTIDNV